MESKWNPSPSRHKESNRRRGRLRLILVNGLRLIPVNGRDSLDGAHRLEGLRSLSELRRSGGSGGLGWLRSDGSGRFDELRSSGSGPSSVRRRRDNLGCRNNLGRRRGNHGPCCADSQERKGME